MDLFQFVRRLVESGQFEILGSSPLVQFGQGARTFLGPTLLPENNVEENVYRESAIRYRTVIANDGSRYSPVQIKSAGQLVGEFLVELGNQDVGSQLTSRDYDALLRLLQNSATLEAEAEMIRFVDRTVVQPLVELIEKQRWEALIDAQVTRTGDNGYTETVTYPNPAGHRVAAGGTWSDDLYDPYEDIVGMVDLLADKGYAVNRIIGSRKVLSILTRNEQIAKRFATIRTLSDSDLYGRLSASQLQAGMAADSIPAIETYELRYNTMTATHRFVPDDTLIFVSTTGRDEVITAESEEEGDIFLPDTLGYTAIGRPAGRPNPGRTIYVEPHDNKPPRLQCEGWQTSLPVITEPEAIAVISGIG